jgi:isoleucyl-tRNA synthetase
MPKLQQLPARPNLSELEESILKYWQENQSFEKSVQMRDQNKAYVFYDGPPFATGLPHYGHLLGSTSKDVVPRYWTMKGYRVERVWGWDCHGLPIENMIEQQLDIKGGKKGIEELGIDKFNLACKTEVLRLDTEWEKIIARLGRWVDFKNNYKTMDLTFMESVWWGFKQLFEKDLIYQGRKIVMYCPRCSTLPYQILKSPWIIPTKMSKIFLFISNSRFRSTTEVQKIPMNTLLPGPQLPGLCPETSL